MVLRTWAAALLACWLVCSTARLAARTSTSCAPDSQILPSGSFKVRVGFEGSAALHVVRARMKISSSSAGESAGEFGECLSYVLYLSVNLLFCEFVGKIFVEACSIMKVDVCAFDVFVFMENCEAFLGSFPGHLDLWYFPLGHFELFAQHFLATHLVSRHRLHFHDQFLCSIMRNCEANLGTFPDPLLSTGFCRGAKFTRQTCFVSLNHLCDRKWIRC